MKRFFPIALCATCTLFPAAASAEDPKPAKKTPVQIAFEKLDTNSDEQVSADEFCIDKDGKPLEGKKREGKEKIFKKFDTDGSGSLSLDEFKRKGVKPKEPKN